MRVRGQHTQCVCGADARIDVVKTVKAPPPPTYEFLVQMHGLLVRYFVARTAWEARAGHSTGEDPERLEYFMQEQRAWRDLRKMVEES